MVFISLGIAIPITIFSEEIITIAYGSDFIEAASVLTIYIWAGIPVFLGTANSQYLINENFTKISLARTVIGMILNIALNFLLIPKYGLTGSAWATLISYFISVFFIILIPKSRREGIRLFSSLLLIKPLLRILK
jgi:O-antigen/teichoic acid export membrane protein